MLLLPFDWVLTDNEDLISKVLAQCYHFEKDGNGLANGILLYNKICCMDNKRTILQDDKTRDRIHQHLSNPSDVISDEDIEQAKTEAFDEVGDRGSKEPTNSENKDEVNTNNNEDKEDGEADGGMVTPWNILGA